MQKYNSKMYKTIRHGENSLQYTILPQNDDFRLAEGGKLGTTTGSSSGNKPPKRGRRKSFFAYLGALFVCTVIVGAILIPFLVSAECLPNPSDWFAAKSKLGSTAGAEQQHKVLPQPPAAAAAARSFNRNITTGRKNSDDASTTMYAAGLPGLEQQPTTVNNPVTSENVFTIPIFSIDQNKLQKNVQNDLDHQISGDVNAIATEETDISYVHRPNQAATTTTTTTTTIKISINGIDTTTSPAKFPIPVKAMTLSKSQEKATLQPNRLFEPIIAEHQEESIDAADSPTSPTGQRSLLTQTSKKPIILPVLAKTNSVIRENGKLLEKEQNDDEPKHWIGSHWPSIDPSTLFQWAGYKSEDSVLLPAILGITLIAVILIVALCLVVRNKRTIVATVRNKRNRNDVEDLHDGGEDNATLLTNGNISEDE